MKVNHEVAGPDFVAGLRRGLANRKGPHYGRAEFSDLLDRKMAGIRVGILVWVLIPYCAGSFPLTRRLELASLLRGFILVDQNVRTRGNL
ncbi:hypothetical protein QYF36_018442 [Acer negundo]|nr:hypothetical protein QYF36_018442 [Acer negundo]